MAPGRAAAYQVKLPVFEGPLDLLLQLVQARKLDVSLVSLAAITGEYVARVKAMEGVRADELAAFLALAAQLLAVKSRLLLPSARDQDTEEDPDGEELLRRLQEYERFKAAAAHLADRLNRDVASFAPLLPRATSHQPSITLDLPGASKLGALLDQIAQRSPRAIVTAPAVVAHAWIEVDTCMQILRDHAVHHEELRFSTLLGESSSPDKIVGLFLALLHLWKWGELDVSQDSPYGDISIRRMSSD